VWRCLLVFTKNCHWRVKKLSIVNLKKNLVPSLIHSQLGTKENWNEVILLPFKTFLIILFYYDINEFPYTFKR
jgi:hypothetical protein